MNAEQVVAAAISALVRGDIAGHLAYVTDDVVAQFNENSSQQGKDAYRQMLELFLRAEAVTGFAQAGAMTDPDGTVVIRMNEDHQMTLKDTAGRILVHRQSVPSFYTVRGNRISRVQLSALSAPNLVFRYP